MSSRGLAVAILVVIAAVLGAIVGSMLVPRPAATTVTFTVTSTVTQAAASAQSPLTGAQSVTQPTAAEACPGRLAGKFEAGRIEAVKAFRSVEELRALIEVGLAARRAVLVVPTVTVPTMAPLPLPLTVKASHPSLAASAEYSSTNVRAPGVDEDDIVKCDGSRLYVVGGDRRKVYVVDAYPPENMSVVRVLRVAEDLGRIIGNATLKVYYGGKEIALTVLKPRVTVQGVYARRGLVVVIAYASLRLPWYPLPRGVPAAEAIVPPVMYGQTWILVYNASSGELLRRYWVSGWFVDSRMINSTVYLVTRLPTTYLPVREPLPYTADGPLPVESVGYAGGWPDVYTIVAAFDVETGDRGALALLGPEPRIMYMTPDGSIYVAMNAAWYRILPLIEMKIRAGDVKGLSDILEDARRLSWNETLILKIEARGTELELNARAVVAGRIPHVFAIDEYDGYLRVVTQIPGRELNVDLYVLNASSLEVVGELRNISPRERIHGVRFIGDKLYLVTFRQVDPLFTIDLSDPRKPRIIGYLKGPGFDEYLHPLPGGVLLGIGREGWKVRVTAYQVTSNGSLVPVSKIVLENTTWTPVLDARKGYRALVVNPADQYILLPASIVKPSIEQAGSAAYVRFKALQGVYVIEWTSEGRLGVKGFVEHPGAVRAAYIDDVCYAISLQSIKAFEESTLRTIREVKLAK